jgi:glycosyltransferase involved in cell wall biosynthesis
LKTIPVPLYLPPTVLFVGVFREAAKDGTVGGQMFACRSLVRSDLGRMVTWRLLDSTQESQPPPGMMVRARNAAFRILRLLGELAFHPPEAALIFSSFTVPSLLEKALMTRILGAAGVRVVLTLRTEVVGREDRNPILETLRRWVTENADVTICQSRRAANALGDPEDLRKGYADVIPNWVTVPSWHRAPSGAESALRQPRFVFIGWLEEAKGVFELLAAFDSVRKSIPGAHLEICGNGSAAAELRLKVRQLEMEDAVTFRGWVGSEEKAAALARAWALVLPSYSEGMPNAVLEAMAAGRAVIASNVGGIPELVEDGESGLLVEPRQVGALAEAMRTLAQNPATAEAMGERGRAVVMERHDLERAWRRIAAALGFRAPEAPWPLPG